MGDMGISLIVIAITGLGIIGIFLFVQKRKKALENDLRELSTQRGWSYSPFKEPLKWGYRLVSPDWTLEAASVTSGNSVEPSQNDVSQKTLINAPTLAIPGLLLLHPRGKTSKPLSPMEEKLAGLAARSFSGGFYGDLLEIPAGSADFRNQFIIMSQTGDLDAKLISPQVESVLLNWKGARPWIKFDSGGMQIEIKGKHITNKEEIKALADLADAFASAFRGKK